MKYPQFTDDEHRLLRAMDNIVGKVESYPTDWPVPPRRMSGFFTRLLYPFSEVCKINQELHAQGLAELDQERCNTFWHEVRKGQAVDEDAGGYILRCWLVATKPKPVDEDSYIQNLLSAADEALGEGNRRNRKRRSF